MQRLIKTIAIGRSVYFWGIQSKTYNFLKRCMRDSARFTPSRIPNANHDNDGLWKYLHFRQPISVAGCMLARTQDDAAFDRGLHDILILNSAVKPNLVPYHKEHWNTA